MASVLYSSERLLRRQPCPPCGSQQSRAAAAACHLSRAARRGTLRPPQASLAQHESDFVPYKAPEWHPQLFPSYPGRRAALSGVAMNFYEEVWNNECVDLLDELAAPGVVFSDTLGLSEDCFSVAGLRQAISDFQAVHPLLRYHVEDVIVDDERDTVVVHYTVTAAHLLPSREGAPATGHVSTVSGMDKIRFDRYCRITSIQSYRQRFLDEEVQMIDWDTV